MFLDAPAGIKVNWSNDVNNDSAAAEPGYGGKLC